MASLLDQEAAGAVASDNVEIARAKLAQKQAEVDRKKRLAEVKEKKRLVTKKGEILQNLVASNTAKSDAVDKEQDDIEDEVLVDPPILEKLARDAQADAEHTAKRRKTSHEQAERLRAPGPAVPVGSLAERLFHGAVPWAMTGVVAAANMVSAFFVPNSGGAA